MYKRENVLCKEISLMEHHHSLVTLLELKPSFVYRVVDSIEDLLLEIKHVTSISFLIINTSPLKFEFIQKMTTTKVVEI